MISWHPRIDPMVSGLIILVGCLWLAYIYRRNRKVYDKKRSIILIVPKIVMLVLLMFAFLDPAINTMRPPSHREKIRILVDTSSSMDVKDSDAGSRVDRAHDLARYASDELDDVVEVEFRTFDTRLHEPDEEPDSEIIRGTDIGTCMATMVEEQGMPGYAAILMLTDGGDRPVLTARMPGPPLFVIGTGTDPSTWNDLAIKDVNAPEEIEQKTPFEVSADIVAYAVDPSFAGKVSAAMVTLAEETPSGWQTIEDKSVSLAKGREKVSLEIPGIEEEGIKKFRLSVKPVDGELTTMNNERVITVEVKKKEVYVLYFSRYIDWDFTLLKRVLKNDQAIKITALYRRGSDAMGQDLLRVEGDRREGDEIFRRGFPTDEKLLAAYRCIILGSFPAKELRASQFQALQRYVEQGGSIIFLGGRDSFGRGGYADTAIATLMPWHISPTERELTTGKFPVSATDLAMEHNATKSAAKTLQEIPVPEIYSVNHVGRLRPGAVSLFDVTVGRHVIAVMAIQPYGLGQTVGIASDTLWRWEGKRGKLKKVHKQLWQQLMRYMCDKLDGGRFLTVKWDRASYLPSELAEASIRVIGKDQMSGQLRLRGELVKGKESEIIPINPVLGKRGEYSANIYFSRRGVYTFKLEAFTGTERLDQYERVFRVLPRVNEGADLELDEPFLSDLASRCGGYYRNQRDAEELIDLIREKVVVGSVRTSVPLVQDKLIYFIILLTVLVAEWFMRRRMNIF